MRFKTSVLILFVLTIVAIDTTRSQAIWQQDFSDSIPPGWIVYKEYAADGVGVSQGQAYMYKYSVADKALILATEELDLSQYSRLNFDVMMDMISDPCEIQIGLVTDSLHIATSFQLINSFVLNDSTDANMNTKEVILKGYPQKARLAFRLTGAYFLKIIFLDNLKLYNDSVSSCVPLGVHDFQCLPAPRGELRSVIKWTNPSKRVDALGLADLDSVVILQEGAPIFTRLNPKIGAPDSVIIPCTKAGFYSFIAETYNSCGKGYLADVPKTWIGMDVPDKPSIIALTLTGNIIDIRWSPPAAGLHGAYFDGTVSRYAIRRADSVCAYVPGAQLHFTDSLTNSGAYNYTIAAADTSGEGGIAATDPFQYLTDGYLLYEDFWIDAIAPLNASPLFPFLWTTSSTSTKSYWMRDSHAGNKGSAKLQLQNKGTSDDDTMRLISPVIDTRGFSNLTVEWRAHWQAQQDRQFTVMLESSADGGNTRHPVYRWNVNSSIDGKVMRVLTQDVGSGALQFDLCVLGSTFNISAVSLDDVRLYPATRTDLALDSIELPGHIKAGDRITPTLVVSSNSTQVENFTALTSIVNAADDRDTVYTFSVHASVDINGKTRIECDPWTALEGNYFITATILNGRDGTPADNMKRDTFPVFNPDYRNAVVLEEFTGTWCPSCPHAAVSIEDLMTMNKPVAVVAYHDDKYGTPQGNARASYYNVTAIPTAIFNGLSRVVGSEERSILTNQYQWCVDSILRVHSPIKITVTAGRNGRMMSASVDIVAIPPLSNPDLVLCSVLTEDIMVKWSTLDALYHAERAMYPDAIGKAIDLGSGRATAQMQFEIPDTVLIENAHFVAFVQDRSTHEIFDGMDVKIGSVETAVASIMPDKSAKIFPNPATNMLLIATNETRHVVITNLLGVKIADATITPPMGSIDIRRLAPGNYFVFVSNRTFGNASIISVMK